MSQFHEQAVNDTRQQLQAGEIYNTFKQEVLEFALSRQRYTIKHLDTQIAELEQLIADGKKPNWKGLSFEIILQEVKVRREQVDAETALLLRQLRAIEVGATIEVWNDKENWGAITSGVIR